MAKTTVPPVPAVAPPMAPIPAPSKSFPSHLDVPPGSLDPRAHALCDILTRIPQHEIEFDLSRCGIPPLPELVESVLRHSYSNPAGAVRFFRWAAASSPHSSVAWNLMVDLLGKNGLFEALWDAVRSMRQEPGTPLSITTFISIFGSYCSTGRVKEAIMTFDVMDRYGIKQDVFAVNSLLSAICGMGGHTSEAADFFDRIKAKIAPDADTFAILLEGWEKEGNVPRAKSTFGEMVVRLGWDPRNMSAHDAFLATLVRGGEASEAVKFLHVMKSKGCLPGMKFFANALDILFQQKDQPNAAGLWDIIVGSSGLVPNTIMYNAMITLHCDRCDFTSAWRLLDEMPLQGVFPDSITYNTIFESLVRNKRVREADKFLAEMRRNEWPPTPSNCLAAIRMFFDQFDPDAALEVWKYVVEDHVSSREECANELLVGLRDLGRMTEVRRHVEGMLDMGIELQSTTLVKLKNGFQKIGRLDLYDRIEKKLKPR